MRYFYDTEFLEGKQSKKFLGIKVGETKPTIDLISIGIVSEDNREYYAISKDFNLDEAWNRYDEKTVHYSGDLRNQFPNGRKHKVFWIRENVLMPIFFELAMREFHDLHFKDQWYHNGKEVTLEILKSNPTWANDKKWFKKLLDKYGKTNEQIKQEVISFIIPEKSIRENKIIDYPVIYGYYSAYDHVVFCWLFGLMNDLPQRLPMYTRDLKQMIDELVRENIDRECYRSGNHTVISFEQGLKELKENSSYPQQSNEHNALSDARWNKQLYNFIKGM